MTSVPMTVLDLVTVREGEGPAEALAASADLACAAEASGYARFWVAEHHGMDGIAGGATAVVLAHIGAATRNIRIGAGGIMLPNHNPFVIAEQFGTLAALYGDRIDLGLGRAPGGDGRLAAAVRKEPMAGAQAFPQDVLELQAYMQGDGAPPIRPTPGTGAGVPLTILGSSLYGAQLAAALGLPYAFASHFAPDHLMDALRIYRDTFRPSPQCERPYAMAAMTVLCADTDAEAAHLASSQEQAFVALRTGTPGKLRPPVDGYRATLPAQAAAMLDQVMRHRAVGAPGTVRDAIRAFVAATGIDELIVAGSTYDPAARIRSLELTKAALAA